MKLAVRIAAVVILSYVGVCAVLYFVQDSLLYPRSAIPEVAWPGADSVHVKCGDAILKIWVLHPGKPRAVIYFGGNAEDVGASVPDLSEAFPDRTVYLVNYRGYGGSTGTPSEAALIADAQAIYDWAAPHHQHISVVGRSLGTGVGTALAASRPVEQLILITPFDSLVNVAAEHYPWVPVHWLLKDRYDSVARIRKVHAPVLVLVGERDQVVPRARSDALLAAIPSSERQTVLIKGATHDDLDLYFAYLETHQALIVEP